MKKYNVWILVNSVWEYDGPNGKPIVAANRSGILLDRNGLDGGKRNGLVKVRLAS